MTNEEISKRLQEITEEITKGFIYNPKAQEILAELRQIQADCPHDEVDEEGFCKFCKRGGCI